MSIIHVQCLPLCRTVEINNTDAEGRLVLGDGVSVGYSNILVQCTFVWSH